MHKASRPAFRTSSSTASASAAVAAVWGIRPSAALKLPWARTSSSRALRGGEVNKVTVVAASSSERGVELFTDMRTSSEDNAGASRLYLIWGAVWERSLLRMTRNSSTDLPRKRMKLHEHGATVGVSLSNSEMNRRASTMRVWRLKDCRTISCSSAATAAKLAVSGWPSACQISQVNGQFRRIL